MNNRTFYRSGDRGHEGRNASVDARNPLLRMGRDAAPADTFNPLLRRVRDALPPVEFNQEPVSTSPPPIRVTEFDKEMFGQEIHDKFQDLAAPRERAPLDFVPKVKSIDAVFKEDQTSSDNYAAVIDEDDAIQVEGIKGELVRLDKWEDGGLPDPLLNNIKRANYIKPREIQKTAVPLILDGFDVTGHAETGSGKTAAYLIPVIAGIIEAKNKGAYKPEPFYPFAVILSPSRELVRQCYEQACKFAADTGVTVAKAYGEYPTRENKNELRQGCDIIIATVGRFKHFVDHGVILLNKLYYLVFDEGDHLLSNQFLNDIRPIMELPSFPKVDKRQTLFFSATFNEDMLQMAKQFMRPDAFVLVSNHKNAANKKCVQEFVAPEHNKKFSILVDFLKNELVKAKNDVNKFPRTLIFCNTREYCEKLALALSYSGISCKPLSGLRAQDLREEAFDEFRANEISCLIVTDVCARGIDIKELDLVINFDMPNDFETYVHRVGRTGRIRNGRAISYVNTDPRRLRLLEDIKKSCEQAGQIVPESLEAILANAIEFNSSGGALFSKPNESVSEAKSPEDGSNALDIENTNVDQAPEGTSNTADNKDATIVQANPSNATDNKDTNADQTKPPDVNSSVANNKDTNADETKLPEKESGAAQTDVGSNVAPVKPDESDDDW